MQANISIRLAPVIKSRHTEKIAVNPATIPNRTVMLRTWYNNTIEQIGNKENIKVPMISVYSSTLASEYLNIFLLSVGFWEGFLVNQLTH